MRIYFATLVTFFVINFSQFWCLSRSFFPNFGQGPFSKLLEKALILVMYYIVFHFRWRPIPGCDRYVWNCWWSVWIQISPVSFPRICNLLSAIFRLWGFTTYLGRFRFRVFFGMYYLSNPFKPDGLFFHYQLDQSISV